MPAKRSRAVEDDQGAIYVLPQMIVALREKEGLNQTEYANRLQVSPSAVNQVERGDRGLQEGLFKRYVAELGYEDELDALEAGVVALRARQAAAAAAAPAPPPRAKRAPKRAAAPKTRPKRRRR